jgi:prophage antirepressor-like protein
MKLSKSAIVPFDFDGINIRTLTKEDAPWFVAADVCDALDIKDASMAATRLDDDEKGTSTIGTPSGTQQMLVINESGLYSLILTSRKPEAKKFKKWVTSMVLPAIRKTGQYQEDWRRSRHAAASSTKVMTDILEYVRDVIGKVTKPHHFMNEHKLINSLLTGQYKGLDREKLSTDELDFMAHFELREAVFIGMGMPYEQRKQHLVREVALWKSRCISGNDDKAIIAA